MSYSLLPIFSIFVMFHTGISSDKHNGVLIWEVKEENTVLQSESALNVSTIEIRLPNFKVVHNFVQVYVVQFQ